MHFLKRTLRRLLGGTEALLSRMYGWKWNPMHQAGTVSALMLLVLVATGLYLVMVYRVGDPAASVARLAADHDAAALVSSVLADSLRAALRAAARRVGGPHCGRPMAGVVDSVIAPICHRHLCHRGGSACPQDVFTGSELGSSNTGLDLGVGSVRHWHGPGRDRIRHGVGFVWRTTREGGRATARLPSHLFGAPQSHLRRRPIHCVSSQPPQPISLSRGGCQFPRSCRPGWRGVWHSSPVLSQC